MFPGKVPMIGTVGVVFTICAALLLPIVLAILCRKKLKSDWLPLLIGAVTFVLFALVLEQLLHAFMLGTFGEKLTGNILYYALYGGIAAALFEETGRWVAMRFVIRKRLSAPNALMYGVGHGGIEAMILVLPTYFANIVAIAQINSGAMEAMLSTVDEATRAATVGQLLSFWNVETYMFFMAGVERISAIVLHIALSYLVYRAVKEGSFRWWGLAVLIHFIVDTTTVLIANSLPIWLLEIVVFAMSAAAAVYACSLIRKERAASRAAEEFVAHTTI